MFRLFAFISVSRGEKWESMRASSLEITVAGIDRYHESAGGSLKVPFKHTHTHTFVSVFVRTLH